MKTAIIGGGASGFFAAINTKENFPNSEVSIFEKSSKLLSKVLVSGGGRCNVTNSENSISNFSKSYPRGENHLKKLFGRFNNQNTIEWFENRGVEIVAEEDGRMFPKSNTSQTIYDLFISESKNLGVRVNLKSSVTSLIQEGEKISVQVNGQKLLFDKVIVCTGGSPKLEGFDWLKILDHKIESPVPSLFTFNIPNEKITQLMGLSVPSALVSIEGTKLRSTGPLLITHWGFSGPAVLKLSSFGARNLSDKNYNFRMGISWCGENNFEKVKEEIQSIINTNQKKKLFKIRPYNFPKRLWSYLLERSDLSAEKPYSELGTKQLNKLVQIICNDSYVVSGKTTYKEEFVTCGGINLESINFKTMESKHIKNLYFAGEILDIDGITGGFNFQSAWTTAFIASKLN
ncbi:MAG: aminoacetone oxidase family FAD-binding enzyme [Flavobacteriales bacterium]|nr:aminoacetone oxidase family FAD-binding enzyme [Flavobacteriales bacterium]|tara:strand:+ start:18280 stop:19485 length:1206 start_codon:yes stop_codon:yes gene_type:complete